MAYIRTGLSGAEGAVTAGILATAMPRGDVVGVARFVDHENRLCCEVLPHDPSLHRPAHAGFRSLSSDLALTSSDLSQACSSCTSFVRSLAQ